MAKDKQVSRIRFLLLVCLTTSAFIPLLGCAGLGQIADQQIRERLIESLSNVRNYSYEMEMNMETSIDGEDCEIAQSKGYGEIDVAAKSMMISIEMVEDSPGKVKTKSTRTLIYLIDNMAYSCFGGGKGETRWLRFKVSKDRLESENRVKNQVDLLLSSKIENLGDEKAGNTDYYLVSIEPDARDFWGLIMEQEEEHPLLKLLDLDYADIVKEMDMRVWIDKKTFLPSKCAMQMKAIIERTMMKQPFEMTISVSTVCTYHDYNKLTAIELPEEAKKAETYKEEWD